jgi:hypothetical protein
MFIGEETEMFFKSDEDKDNVLKNPIGILYMKSRGRYHIIRQLIQTKEMCV